MGCNTITLSNRKLKVIVPGTKRICEWCKKEYIQTKRGQRYCGQVFCNKERLAKSQKKYNKNIKRDDGLPKLKDTGKKCQYIIGYDLEKKCGKPVKRGFRFLCEGHYAYASNIVLPE